MKKSHGIKLETIKSGLLESPPPPPAGTSMREWFAGLALANPALMLDVAPNARAAVAVRLADELVRALAAPRVPSAESFVPPSPAEFDAWEKKIADDNEKSAKRRMATVPAVPCLTLNHHEFPVIPPAATSGAGTKDKLEETRYSFLGCDTE